MHFTTIPIVFITAQLCTVNTARILGIFAFPGPSQYIFVEPLLKELARRGHHITSISNFPQTQTVENFRDIVIKENAHLFDEFTNFSVDNMDHSYYDTIGGFYTKTVEMSNNVHNHPLVKDLKQNESFDLIIMDVFFSESFFGFAEHFRAPMVGISPWGTMASVDELVGNTTPLSYIPNMMMLRQYNRNMNFWRRCLNVLVFFLEWIHYYFEYFPIHVKIYKEQFPNASRTLDEAQRNFSLVLLNDHFTISTPRPYVPNMIEVAGMHIPSRSDPLSKDIEALLQEATQGVIYVTIDPLMPEQTLQTILNQFAQCQQLVLWKAELKASVSVRIPSNVHFRSNVPHHAVLTHSNINLLISYGEYLSIIESIHYGVPILGISPFDGFPDDYVDNIKKVGNGISLRWNEISVKTLSRAFHDLLTIDRYRNEAKRKSQLFRDQQTTPMERAIYWIEYILRHKGADHLRNLGQNLSIWEFYNLDVFIVISFIIVAFMCFSYISMNIFIKVFMRIKY